MKPPRSVFVLSFAILLSACNFSLAADVTPPPGYQPPPSAAATVEATASPLYPLVPPDPAKGEAVFAANCTPCHGATGLGDGPRAVELPNPPDPIGASGAARRATPAEWFEIVTQGDLERFMPPFHNLTDRQRWDVVAYSFSLSVPGENILRGKEIFQANCAACHGEGGRGDGAAAKELDLPDFGDQELMANESALDLFQAISNGVPPAMPAFGERLSEDERWALTDFFRSLTFASQAPETSSAASSGQPALSPTSAAALESQPSEVVTTTFSLSDTLGLGVVSGTVENASGGELPSNLEVALHGFDKMQIVITETARLGADGSYVFEPVEMPAGRAFLTTIEFASMIYASEVMIAGEGQTRIELPIRVFESTSDPSVLVVDRLHYFFEFLDENTLRVVELYIISNPGTETLVATADGQPVLTYQLPPGASNLDFQEGSLGGRYVLTENGFGDMLPVRPGMGEYQVLFSYELPYERKLELTRPVSIAANAIVILIPEDGLKVKGETIQEAGTRDVQGLQYRMYNGGSLSVGEELRLTISGRPQSDSPSLSAGSKDNLLVGMGAFGVVLVLAGAWLYARNRGSRANGGQTIQLEGEPHPEDAGEIMDAILALDDLYREGQLPEEGYLRRRAELKERLRGVLGE